MRSAVRFLFLGGMVSLAGLLTSTARAGEIAYAGDYNQNNLVRFDGTTGAVVWPAPWQIDGGESVAGRGNSIFSAGKDNIIREYQTDGTSVGSFDPGSGNLGLAVSLDGKFLYATHSGSVAEYDVQGTPGTNPNFGHLVSSISTPDSWGVAIDPNTGNVYVNNGWSNGNSGVTVYSADLTTTIKTLTGVPAGAGIVFSKDGLDYWVVNGGNQQGSAGQSYVSEYKTSDDSLVQTVQLDLITATRGEFRNAFGAGIDNAGNIYVSSQASNAVIEINPTTYAESIFINSNNGATDSIKSIFFSGQTVDPVIGTPEPGSVVMIATAIPATLFMWLRRRRKSA